MVRQNLGMLTDEVAYLHLSNPFQKHYFTSPLGGVCYRTTSYKVFFFGFFFVVNADNGRKGIDKTPASSVLRNSAPVT